VGVGQALHEWGLAPTRIEALTEAGVLGPLAS
jgi:hypothetical protein